MAAASHGLARVDRRAWATCRHHRPLDIKGPNLIKGVHLEGLRVMGDPQEHALRYYEEGADELLYMDIVASLYERNNLSDIIRRAADGRVHARSPWAAASARVDDARQLLALRAPTRWRSTRLPIAPAGADHRDCTTLRLAGNGALDRGEAARSPGAGRRTPTTAASTRACDVVDWARRGRGARRRRDPADLGRPRGHRKGFDLDLIRTVSAAVRSRSSRAAARHGRHLFEAAAARRTPSRWPISSTARNAAGGHPQRGRSSRACPARKGACTDGSQRFSTTAMGNLLQRRPRVSKRSRPRT